MDAGQRRADQPPEGRCVTLPSRAKPRVYAETNRYSSIWIHQCDKFIIYKTLYVNELLNQFEIEH